MPTLDIDEKTVSDAFQRVVTMHGGLTATTCISRVRTAVKQKKLNQHSYDLIMRRQCNHVRDRNTTRYRTMFRGRIPDYVIS